MMTKPTSYPTITEFPEIRKSGIKDAHSHPLLFSIVLEVLATRVR